MALASGLRIGKYELGRKLGEGGFGLVFIGRDVELDREVALKFMHAHHTANAEILRRFLQEARSAAKIVHPGIVTVFECGQISNTGTEVDGIAYIAMELLHGESLSDRLQRSGRLSAASATEITRQVASALEAAHRAGIIHRDLKPDNIFLMTDPAMPGGERVKVLDFGIAKLAQAQTSGVQTHSQMVFGTPRYMSPEQCRSAAHIDHRSDIYTLGCILFELVVGEPPFDGEMGELIAKHQMVAAPIAKSRRPDLPAHLDALITMMLAKSPGARPQTMQALGHMLESGASMSPGTAPTLMPEPGESLPRFTPTPGTLGESAAEANAAIAAARAKGPVATTLGAASRQIDPTAEAYRKAPDLAKARATFEQYRDRVQVGGRSDLARKKIAEIADEMAKAEQAERDRRLAHGVQRPTGQFDMPRRKSRFSAKWLVAGGALLLGGLAADLLPASGKNGRLDGTDFIAPAMYAFGATAVIVGVF